MMDVNVLVRSRTQQITLVKVSATNPAPADMDRGAGGESVVELEPVVSEHRTSARSAPGVEAIAPDRAKPIGGSAGPDWMQPPGIAQRSRWQGSRPARPIPAHSARSSPRALSARSRVRCSAPKRPCGPNRPQPGWSWIFLGTSPPRGTTRCWSADDGSAVVHLARKQIEGRLGTAWYLEEPSTVTPRPLAAGGKRQLARRQRAPRERLGPQGAVCPTPPRAPGATSATIR
jgi:hypothetical protein